MNNEFSFSAAREARIDRAIDRAVREMMQVDPPPGLQRRVLARLNEPKERRTYLLARYAFAAIGIVVLMMSITLLTDRVEPPTPPKPPMVALPAPAPAIEAAIQTEIQATPGARPAAGITRERIHMPSVTNVFGTRSGAVTATTIDAGKRVIVVPPLKIVPLSARPTVITPLIIPPMAKGGGV
jgi:hypothetical protein